jgi:hypothetical protein
VLRFLPAIFVTLLLSACATTSTPPVNPGPDPDGDGLVTTKQLGAMIVLEGHIKDAPESTPVLAYALANFYALPKAADLPLDPLSYVFDTCLMTKTPPANLMVSSVTLPSLPELPIPQLPSLPTFPGVEGLEGVSAGAELTLKNGSRDYMILTGQTGAYSAQPLAGQIPAELTVTLPGAIFPAREHVTFPETVPTFGLQSPTDVTALRADTAFSWATEAASEDTFILLFGSSDDRTSQFVCYAKDDGSFVFPKSTSMATAAFTGKLDGAARLRYRSDFKDDSLFMPMIGSLEIYLELEVPTLP